MLRFIPILEQETYDEFGKALNHYEMLADPYIRNAFVHLINDNFYVLTQVALGIFSLLRPPHISYDSYSYMCASNSIWPLFEKVAQGADPFLLDDDVSLFNNSALLREYENYAVCILQIANFNTHFKGLVCNPNWDSIQALGTLKDSGYILEDLSLPELPATLENLVAPHFTVRKSTASAQESLAKEKTEKGAKLTPTPQIKRKKKSTKRKGPFQNSEQKPVDLANLAILSSAPLIEPVSTPPEAAESTMSTVTESANNTQLQIEHIFAGWIINARAGSNLAGISLNTDPLTFVQQNFLRNIFGDNTRITYEVFESLWQDLNGPNSIKKSNQRSHRRLLDSQGMVVGDVFALYGPKHRYTDKNKQDLLGALTLIGYGQDYLDTLVIG